jgi:hypothetical protein
MLLPVHNHLSMQMVGNQTCIVKDHKERQDGEEKSSPQASMTTTDTTNNTTTTTTTTTPNYQKMLPTPTQILLLLDHPRLLIPGSRTMNRIQLTTTRSQEL